MHESFNKHDINKVAQEAISIAQRPIVCEVCGKVLATLTNAYNFWVNAGIGVPGSPDISNMSCESGQHWACSLECWAKVAHACIDIHIAPTIKKAHELLEERRLAFEKEVQNVNSGNKI